MEASQFICYSVSQLQRRKTILYVTCQMCAQESSPSLSHPSLPADFQKLWKDRKNLTWLLFFYWGIFTFVNYFHLDSFFLSFERYLLIKICQWKCGIF